MNANHTPGPWEFVAADNYEVHSRLIPYKFPHNFPEDSTGPFVALIGNHVSDFGEANARLIAAAPELLAACQQARSMTPDGGYTASVLDSAISKATGAKTP